jgi:hypothetical protein
MEDKRGTKRSHSRSPLKEGSSSPSSVSTPPSSPSRSTPPPGSPSEVSSRRLRSPIFGQGRPSERISEVDLSSDEGDFFLDTSWDEEFTRKLFGDLDRSLLGLPNDGNVIILNDFDEEEEVREEGGVQNDSNDYRTPDRAQGNNSSGGDEVGSP